MMRWSQYEGTGQPFSNRALVLPLNACLVLAYSVSNAVQAAEASESERLHKLFRGQQVNVTLKNPGAYMEGRVEKVHKGSVTVDVETSSHLSSIPLGFQEIPVDRLSTVRWRQGSIYQVILTTVGVLGGLVAGLWIGMPEDSLHWGGGNILPLMLFPALGGTVGHFSGKRLDQRQIIFESQRLKSDGARG